MNDHVGRKIIDGIPNYDICSHPKLKHYTPYYCEENIWHLCNNIKQFENEKLNNCYAVFISNEKKIVPLCQQKLGKGDLKVVHWDYHVIFVYKDSNGHSLVYDFDTTLSYPSLFSQYVMATFPSGDIYHQDNPWCFRVIPASTYLLTFASDRSHMKFPNGSWINPPPKCDTISTQESSNNLEEFISMDPSRGVGTVCSLGMFVDKFTQKK